MKCLYLVIFSLVIVSCSSANTKPTVSFSDHLPNDFVVTLHDKLNVYGLKLSLDDCPSHSLTNLGNGQFLLKFEIGADIKLIEGCVSSIKRIAEVQKNLMYKKIKSEK